MSVLRDVGRSDAFARVRSFDDCARFHVWHSRLSIAEPIDRRAQEAMRAGRGYAVVGPPGSGKTSTLAAAIASTDGFELARLPLRLSVSGAGTPDVHDPRFLASRIVRAVAHFSAEAQTLIDQAVPAGRVAGAATTFTGQLGAGALKVAKELQRRTESFDFERTPDEVIEVAVDAVRLLVDTGLRPVVLLEDADGLLRLPGKSDEERHDTADAFFVDGLDPVLRALPIPAVIAIQPDYLRLEGFQRVSAHFDGVGDVPSPSQLSSNAVQLLLGETLAASSASYTVAQVFSDEGLGVLLHNRFSLQTMRELIGVSAASVLKALDEGHNRIEGDDVGYAVSQR
jgi:hypothetical protein